MGLAKLQKGVHGRSKNHINELKSVGLEIVHKVGLLFVHEEHRKLNRSITELASF